jgi:RNA polymerase primary sigma factor
MFVLKPKRLEATLAKLSDLEAMVLRLLKGLMDGRERTLVQVGQYFAVTRERIKQIEAMALRRIKYQEVRTQGLRDFLGSVSQIGPVTPTHSSSPKKCHN